MRLIGDVLPNRLFSKPQKSGSELLSFTARAVAAPPSSSWSAQPSLNFPICPQHRLLATTSTTIHFYSSEAAYHLNPSFLHFLDLIEFNKHVYAQEKAGRGARCPSLGRKRGGGRVRTFHVSLRIPSQTIYQASISIT